MKHLLIVILVILAIVAAVVFGVFVLANIFMYFGAPEWVAWVTSICMFILANNINSSK